MATTVLNSTSVAEVLMTSDSTPALTGLFVVPLGATSTAAAAAETTDPSSSCADSQHSLSVRGVSVTSQQHLVSASADLTALPYTSDTRINYHTTRILTILKGKGGIWLPPAQYISCRSKIRVACALGHEWEIEPFYLMQGNWCSKCKHVTKIRQQHLCIQKVIDRQQGKWLAGKYTGHKSKITIECKVGHVFQIKPYNLRTGHWCSKCANVHTDPQYNMDKIHKLLAAKRYKHLDGSYTNSMSKFLLECCAGHQFTLTAHHIKAGHGCIICKVFGEPTNGYSKLPPNQVLSTNGYSELSSSQVLSASGYRQFLSKQQLSGELCSRRLTNGYGLKPGVKLWRQRLG